MNRNQNANTQGSKGFNSSQSSYNYAPPKPQTQGGNAIFTMPSGATTQISGGKSNPQYNDFVGQYNNAWTGPDRSNIGGGRQYAPQYTPGTPQFTDFNYQSTPSAFNNATPQRPGTGFDYMGRPLGYGGQVLWDEQGNALAGAQAQYAAQGLPAFPNHPQQGSNDSVGFTLHPGQGFNPEVGVFGPQGMPVAGGSDFIGAQIKGANITGYPGQQAPGPGWSNPWGAPGLINGMPSGTRPATPWTDSSNLNNPANRPITPEHHLGTRGGFSPGGLPNPQFMNPMPPLQNNPYANYAKPGMSAYAGANNQQFQPKTAYTGMFGGAGKGNFGFLGGNQNYNFGGNTTRKPSWMAAYK